MQKTDLKVGFQAVVRIATHAVHTHEKRTQRIESITCIVFFVSMHCVFRFLIVLPAVHPLRCVQQLGNRM